MIERFIFLKQNAAGFLWAVPGMVVITIALMIVYNRILRKYERKKQGKESMTGDIGL